MTRFIGLVDGAADGCGMIFPDLPGCYSGGESIDATMQNAVEAVRLWAEDAIADGETLPEPRSLEAMRDDSRVAARLAAGAAIVFVPLLLDAGRPARANLSIDAGLLAAIDEAAALRGVTRSAFLASAAREKIASEG